MANAVFPKGLEGFLDGSIDWDTDDIRAMLVLSTYTYDSTDQFVSDLGAVDNGRSSAMGSKTKTDGIADCADFSIVATAASASKAVVFFKHTGSDATARLIAYFDTGAGLPFTPAAGATINVTIDNGANKLFKL